MRDTQSGVSLVRCEFYSWVTITNITSRVSYDSIEELESNSKVRSEYLAGDEFQVTTNNAGLNVARCREVAEYFARGVWTFQNILRAVCAWMHRMHHGYLRNARVDFSRQWSVWSKQLRDYVHERLFTSESAELVEYKCVFHHNPATAWSFKRFQLERAFN